MSPRTCALGLALLLAPVAAAEMLLEIPEGEQPGVWEPVLQSVGLGLGSAGSPPWARLVAVDEGSCVLEVATSWGAQLAEPVACPRSASEREDVAALAVLMLEPLVRGERSLATLPPPRPGPRHDDAPAGKRRLEDADAPGPHSAGEQVAEAAKASAPPHFEFVDGEIRSVNLPPADATMPQEPTGSSGGPGGSLTGDSLDSPELEAHLVTVSGTNQFNPLCYYTDCAVSFDRRTCGEADGCSTAAKCPDTYWLDFDRDGFGSPQTCLSLATERGVGAWVQNVGDCDDRHSSIHPDAVEVDGDGIDNDCDGVAR